MHFKLILRQVLIGIGDDDVNQAINIGTQGDRTISIATGAFPCTLDFGTGGAAMACTLGSTNTTSRTDIVGGATGVHLTSAGAVEVNGGVVNSGVTRDAGGAATITAAQLINGFAYSGAAGGGVALTFPGAVCCTNCSCHRWYYIC